MKWKRTELIKLLTSIPRAKGLLCFTRTRLFLFTGKILSSIAINSDIQGTINAEKAHKFLKSTNEPEVQIVMLEGFLGIKAGDSKLKLPLIKSDPDLTQLKVIWTEAVSITEWCDLAEDFLDKLDQIKISLLREKTSGDHFAMLENFYIYGSRAYSTDGLRISCITIKPFHKDVVLLPGGILPVLKKIKADKYCILPDILIFRNKTTKAAVIIKRAAVVFPSIVPAIKEAVQNKDKVTLPLPKDKILTALKSIAAANTQSIQISCSKKTMVLTSITDDKESVETSIDSDKVLPQVSFMINPSFLKDALTELKAEAVQINDDRTTAIFRKDEHLHLVKLVVWEDLPDNTDTDNEDIPF